MSSPNASGRVFLTTNAPIRNATLIPNDKKPDKIADIEYQNETAEVELMLRNLRRGPAKSPTKWLTSRPLSTRFPRPASERPVNREPSRASIGADKTGTMPKMKTNKSAAKRFRVSGTGRVRRPKAGGNHMMQEKSRKRVRRLRNNDMVDGTLERSIKRLIPYK